MPKEPKIPVVPIVHPKPAPIVSVKPGRHPPYKPVMPDTDVKIKAIAASIKKQLEDELKSIDTITYRETEDGVYLLITIVNGDPVEFLIPKGPQGEPGPAGPQGPKGDPLRYEDLTHEQKVDLVGPLWALVNETTWDIEIDAGVVELAND